MLFTPRSLSRRNVSAPFVCGGGGVSLFRQPSSHADGGGDDDELATLVTPHGTQTGRPHAVVMPLPFRWAPRNYGQGDDPWVSKESERRGDTATVWAEYPPDANGHTNCYQGPSKYNRRAAPSAYGGGAAAAAEPTGAEPTGVEPAGAEPAGAEPAAKKLKVAAAPYALMITGSRSLKDERAKAAVYSALDKQHAHRRITRLLSGNAAGVDKLAEAWAADRDVPVDRFYPEWDTYGKAAGMRRNLDMIKACDGVIAVWDGESTGTKHAIDNAGGKLLETVRLPFRAVNTMFKYFGGGGSNGGAAGGGGGAGGGGNARADVVGREGAPALNELDLENAARAVPAAGSASAPLQALRPPRSHVLWRDGGNPKPFVILLMVADDKDAARFLEGCRRRCDNEKVHGHCFQREGTRHFTIVKGIRDAQAERLASEGLALVPPLPANLELGPFHKWASCAALSLSPASQAALAPLLRSFRSVQGTVEGPGNLHMSVYRQRGMKEAKNAFMRATGNHDASYGCVRPTRIILKREGSDYDHHIVLAE